MARKSRRKEQPQESRPTDKYVEFARLVSQYRRHPVVLRCGDVIVTVADQGDLYVPPDSHTLMEVPLRNALAWLGLELPENVVQIIEQANVPRAVALAALQVAQNIFDLRDLLTAVGVASDALDVLSTVSPRWATSLTELRQFPVEAIKTEVSPELFEELWRRASLDEKIEVAVYLKDEEVEGMSDLLREAWKEFDSRIYTAELIPLLMGLDAQEYVTKRTAAYRVAKANMIRGPEWVIAVKNVQIIEALPGRKVGKGKMLVDTPIVRLPQKLKDAEEAVDLLDGSTVVLRTKLGVVFILCAYASEIYVVDRGQVTTVPWDEYVAHGLPFVYRYTRPEDVIKYVVVNPKKNAKLVLDHMAIAALLKHFGYDAPEKLQGELPEDVISVLMRLQAALPAPPAPPAPPAAAPGA